MQSNMFSVGDRVQVLNMRPIEVAAGRDTSRECMAIEDKVKFVGLQGEIVAIKMGRRYANLRRNIYEVKFSEDDVDEWGLPYRGVCWFHEEWLDFCFEQLSQENAALDDMFSQL